MSETQRGKHTKTPYSLYEYDDHSGIQIGVKYNESWATKGQVHAVCSLSGGKAGVTEQQRTDARFIVTACNSFESMKAALEAVLNSDMAQREEDEGNESPILNQVRSALALATPTDGNGGDDQ